jgi:YbbR domain-containing protein
MVEWLRDNLGTLALAVILAITAWVAAVSQADPIIEQSFSESIQIEYQGLQDGLTIVGEIPTSGQITLRAPESVWRVISSDDLRLVVDLSDMQAGTRTLQVNPSVEFSATQITALDPAVVPVTIEPLATKTIDISVVLEGTPAADYQSEEAAFDLEQTTVIGPASIIEKVANAEVRIDLTNRQQSIDQDFTLIPVDDEGEPISDLTLEHESVRITIEITRIENIRRLVVIPQVLGQEQLEELGYYRVTRISVTPREVAVFSDDAQALEALPGFIETIPISVDERTTSVDQRVPLNLPEGFSLIGEQSVRVEVSIEPIATTITITRPVEIQSVSLGLYSYVSPEEVDLILTGPAITLDSLEPEDVRVIIDVLDLDQGTYQLEPEVLVLPDDVSWEPPTPALIEVVLTYTPRPTPTFAAP